MPGVNGPDSDAARTADAGDAMAAAATGRGAGDRRCERRPQTPVKQGQAGCCKDGKAEG